MNKFINFLYTLESQDPELIDIILSGYDIIVESFTDVSKSVLITRKIHKRIAGINESDMKKNITYIVSNELKYD